MFFATILEYVTSCGMEKIFNERWWAYSKATFNIDGYDVTEFYEEPIPYSPTGLQKLENIFYRVVFKNPNHIHNIYERNFVRHSNRNIKKLKSKSPHFDYCFIIISLLMARHTTLKKSIISLGIKKPFLLKI